MFARHHIDLPQGSLRFYEAGRGPALVHVHNGAGLQWTAGVERLTQDFTVVLPVLPGFDGTERFDGIRSPEDLGDLTGDFLAARFGEPVALTGNSFGAQVAAWTAILHPERVRRLVLGAPAGLRTPDLEKPRTRGDAEFEPEVFFARPDRRRPDTRTADVLRRDAETFASYRAGRFFDETLTRRLREIRCPTLALCGRADSVVTEKALRYLQLAIAGAELAMLADAGHVLDSDQPEEFAARITAFLRDGDVAHAA